MPNPIINPAVWAAATPFSISNSTYVALDVALANIDAASGQAILTVPAGATVTAIRDPANWTTPGSTLLSGGVWTAVTALGDWSLTVTPGALATDPATLSLSSATSGAGGRLRLVISGMAGALSAEPAGGELSIDRILATPTILNAQVTTPPLPVREQDNVTIAASVSHSKVENPAPSVALPAPPPILSAWTPDPANPIAVKAFLNLGASATFTAPGVYATTPVNFTLKAALDLAANAAVDPSDPFTTATLGPVNIELVRYGMVLVLDRSGSMGGTLGGGMNKWQAATQAAHAWTDLFRAFRPGGSHLAGVVTFENDSGAWTLSTDADVTFRNPSTGAAIAGPAPMAALSSFGNVTTWNLGSDQTNTSIGDGLVKAWTAIGAQLGPNDRGAVVLMTDGYENAGAVTIAAAKGPAMATFAATRVSGQQSAANNLIGPRLYTLAIGTEVDDDRLNALGPYRQITESVNELKTAFGEWLGDVVEAEPLMPMAPLVADPDAPANALYYRVSTGERVLALLVQWSNLTDSLLIGHRPQGSGAAFTPVGPGVAVSVTERTTHALTRVDLPALLGAGAPASEWRLQHVNAANAPQAGLIDRALVMVDLVTKVEVGFTQPHFFVGEPIGLETRIHCGGVPVTDATVLIDSARPGEGLGTYLTQNAVRYKRQQGDFPRPKTDPGKGKGQMVHRLFEMDNIENLPILRASGLPLFDDGAHGDGAVDDGLYANVFNDTEKEGTYTFRFRIEGKLADGSQFSRVFVRSTWVGMRPDPGQLGAVWTVLTAPNVTPVSSQLILTPMFRNEYLGPFRGDAIELKVYGGALDGALVDREDGSYQATVIHDKGATPTVSVSIWGQDMTPTAPTPASPFGPLGANCCKIWHLAFRCTLAGLRKALTGK